MKVLFRNGSVLVLGSEKIGLLTEAGCVCRCAEPRGLMGNVV